MKMIIIVTLLILSVGGGAYVGLLTSEDWAYLEEDNTRPAITFPESEESSYNEWTCHLAENLEIQMVPVIYNEIEMGSPTIYAKDSQRVIEYALDPEPMEFSYEIENKWTSLITGTEEVCLVSAFLQDSPEGEVRIVQRIKTHLGIWDWFEESENYKGPQRDDIVN